MSTINTVIIIVSVVLMLPCIGVLVYTAPVLFERETGGAFGLDMFVKGAAGLFASLAMIGVNQPSPRPSTSGSPSIPKPAPIAAQDQIRRCVWKRSSGCKMN